ncbi:MAG: DNA-directed RNA polymerase subunit beta' [Candidatus Dojkabacteria bacterium]|nr:DNA-directed RNA polymerase subunit beta' [Candidatus Dojkabacteria bacterium]
MLELNLHLSKKEDALDDKFKSLKSLVNEVKQGFTMSEDDYQLLEEYDLYFFDAGMGAEAIKELLEKLDIDEEIVKIEKIIKTSKSALKVSKVIQRLRVLKGIKKSGMSPAWLVLDLLPVIPPDLRPIIMIAGGRFATYDLNDLYRRVINRNNRLKRLIALGAPEIILRNEKRMLQEAVDSLIDNNHKPGAPALNGRQMPFKSLSDMLRGKQGRFRQNLLGKRVDYSGRAVIVAGPNLRFDQCGLPKNIALELFKPFIIRELISRGYAANPNRAKIMFESKESIVWDLLEEVIQDRPVLLNRAPSLHKYSMLAFFPQLIEGNAIRLHPMVCKGYNADFDGDQMAVHLPLSEEAVIEAKERMFAKDNMLHMRDGSPILNVAKDMAMGVFFATMMKGDPKKPKHFFANDREMLSAFELANITFFEPIGLLYKGDYLVTTAGRYIFNSILPEDTFDFFNQELSTKDVSKITTKIFRKFGNVIAVDVLDKIKDIGFRFSTQLGFSVSMGEFRFGAEDLLEKKLEEYSQKEDELVADYEDGLLTDNELVRLQKEEWVDQSEEIQNAVWELAKTRPETENLLDLDASGATPVSAWLKQISGVRGFITDMSGEIVNLPISGNFEKGLSNFEYFVASKAVRKSFTDSGLKTSESGYLTRRLVDVSQDLITKIDDCETEEGLIVDRLDKRQLEFVDRIKGRYPTHDIKDPKSGKVIVKMGDPIGYDDATEIDENKAIESVELRSPLTCNVSHGVCKKCYGFDNGTGVLVEIGQAVGIIAAQALGEPTTQLTLKSKSDARASKSDVTQGLPRVEELLEARTPKALSKLSEIAGEVKIIEDKKGYIVRVTAEELAIETFDIEEGDEVIVKKGGNVKAKDTLIVRKDKTEARSPFSGKVKISEKQGTLTVEAGTAKEDETTVASLADILVEDGAIVERGDQITHGSIDPKELARLKGIRAAQMYIVKGVQDVYGIQGLEVDDRHLEIISRQMGRYGLVSDSGESEEVLPGDYVDVLDIKEENIQLEKAGKKTIKYDSILLGITNSSIRTESFLSAASFEQQVRVLTDAALIGKVDNLRGLKENVIIGRPVPLGKVLIEQNREEVEEAEARVEILTEDAENK